MPYQHPGRPKKKDEEIVKRRCHRCHGSGRMACTICGGQGRIQTSKDIYGKPIMTRCNGCFGTRAVRCTTCAGEGFMRPY
ncbi:MAG: hypothetical protein OEZ19_11305 [Paracoccaceae bacterium]|nr:hypothetical protein [Paracoccaceae bacterium]